MRPFVVLVAACLAACHLAEDIDPPACQPGAHRSAGACVADPVLGPVVTIGAAPCAVSPDSITVAPNAQFSFENKDAVDHTISGADGKEWVIAKAQQPSPFLGITKAGTWPYTVSGCAKGGVVVVQ